MDPDPRRRARRLRVAAIATASAIALYALVGFVIAPPLLRRLIEKRGSAFLGRTLRLERLALNPFALSATAEGFDLRDPDGAPLLRWDRLYVNLQASSLLYREWRLRAVELEGASARVVLLPDGRLNISDLPDRLAPPADPAAPPAPPSPPPRVRIGRLRLANAALNFIDRSTEPTFTTTLGPIRFDIRDLSTQQDARAPFTFAGRTESGEAFSWQGGFSLTPLRAEGSFSLEGVDLTKYRPYYRGTVPFEIRAGNGDLRASYTVEWSAAKHVLRIEDGAATGRGVGLAEPGHEEIAFSAPASEVKGGTVDLLTGEVRIGSFSSTGGHVLLRKYPDKSINLVNMVLPFFDKPAPTPAPAPGSEPLVRLEHVEFKDYTVEAEDQALPRPVKVVLDQVALALHNVDNRVATTSRGTLDVRWNGEGTLHTEGDLSLMTFVADLALKGDKIDLTPLSPYIDPFLDLRLTSGFLSGDGRVKANLIDLSHPIFSWNGDLRLDRIATVDGPKGEPFLSCRSLTLKGLEYDLHTDRMALREAALVGAEGRLAVTADGGTNAAAVLRLAPPPPDEAATPGSEAAATPAAPGSESAATPAAGPAPEGGPAEGGAPAVAGTPAAPGEASAATAATPAAAKARAPAAAPETGLITIGRFAVRDSVLRLVDPGVTPPVTAAMTGIEGSISGLSSVPGKRAKVNIEGKFEGVAPVTLIGELDPLGADVSSDLVLAVRGADLTPFSPWWGRYVGFKLQQGKLDVDMRYRLASRRVSGANLLIADGLTLGDKTDSPDATHLPVRLGLALLRDRHGQIRLDVPVEGSLDDPRFRLGRVILHAIGNVFSKLVTAPFAMLARAFAGHENDDLSVVEFEPGSAAIGSAAASRLDTLATGLYERPELKLSIAGSADEPVDTPALRRARLESLVRQAKWRSLGRHDREATAPEAVVVGAEERPKYVKAAWKALRETLPEDKSEKPETPEAMESWMLERITIAPEDLRRLAADRAAAVRDHLAGGGKVDTARLFIADAAAAKGARAVLEMQ